MARDTFDRDLCHCECTFVSLSALRDFVKVKVAGHGAALLPILAIHSQHVA